MFRLRCNFRQVNRLTRLVDIDHAVVLRRLVVNTAHVEGCKSDVVITNRKFVHAVSCHVILGFH